MRLMQARWRSTTATSMKVRWCADTLALAFLVVTTSFSVRPVAAQDVTEPSMITEGPQSTAPSGEPSIVIMPPHGYAMPVSTPLDEAMLQEADARIRRARNGLIATSAAFGLSIVFLGAGISQCDELPNGELQCSRAGDALGTIGALGFIGAGVGVITTGIMLPVRHRKKRDLQREIHQRRRYSRLRWDAASGGFVF